MRLFLLVLGGLDALAIACELVAKRVLHMSWPYTSFLLQQGFGCDLPLFRSQFQHLHSIEFFSSWHLTPFMYPAPVAPLYSLFYAFHHALRIYEGTIVSSMVCVTMLFANALRRNGLPGPQSALLAGAALVLGYPVMFEIKQGNMEVFVFLLVAGGIWLYLTGRLYPAAVCLGLAAAMKLFPAVYLGLFLARKQYRYITVAALTAALITLASLLYLSPSLSASWHGMILGINWFQQTTALVMRPETSFDHSLWGLIKFSHHELFHRRAGMEDLSGLLRVYLLGAALGGVVLFFTRIRHLPVVNQVLCLCVASVLLPPVSYDYTLMHLYVPWAMLCLYVLHRREAAPAGSTAVFTCLGILLSIQSEFIVKFRPLGGQIKAVVLVALFAIALRYPFREKNTPAEYQPALTR